MYKLTTSECIIRLADGAFIPNDPANTDYAAYLKWLEEGNEPDPVDPPSPEQVYQEWKTDRQTKVDAITVEVDEMVFDGNEAAQSRMSREVISADDMEMVVKWILHDNTVADVTIAQLKQACRLACEAQTEIWHEGRPVA